MQDPALRPEQQLVQERTLEASLTLGAWIDVLTGLERVKPKGVGARLRLRLHGRPPRWVRGFAAPFLMLLREDVAADQAVPLRVDLRPPGDAGTVRPDTGRLDVEVVDEHRTVVWIAGAARLADGAALQWAVGERVRYRTVTRRMPKGRTRKLASTRHVVELDAWLGLPRDRYQLRPRAPRTPVTALRIERGAGSDTVHVRRIADAPPHRMSPDPALLLALVGEAYAQGRPVALGGAAP